MRGYQRFYFAAAVVLLAFFTARLMWITWPFTTDDAYITFKYGRSLAEGHGLVWNIGEPPVEGYSNFIFVLFSAFFSYLDIDPVIPIKLINYASLVGTLYLSYLISSFWVGPLLSLMAPFILVLFFKGTVFWAASGLETSFFQFMALLALWFSFRFLSGFGTGEGERSRTYKRDTLLLGLLLAIVAMIRPEGGLFLIIILSCAWLGWLTPRLWAANGWGNSGFRELLDFTLRVCIVFGAVYGSYWLWRFNYFGYPFPNPYYCKVTAYVGNSRTVLVREFFREARPYLWAGAIAVIVLRDIRILALFIPSAAYMYLLYGVDPVIGHFTRHFMAALAALLPITAIMVKKAAERLTFGKLTGDKAEIVLFTLLLLFVPLAYPPVEQEVTKSVERYLIRTETRIATANFLMDVLPPDSTYVNGDEGLIPYLTEGLNSIDAYCLNDLTLAHEISYKDDKATARYFLDRKPEAIVMASKSKKENIPRTRVWMGILDSPDFAENYELKSVFGGYGDKYYYFTYLRKQIPAR